MLVENVTGSSKVSKKAPYPYTSWLNYWEVNANFALNPNQLYNCPACGKPFYRKDFDGCHVQKANNISKCTKLNDITYRFIFHPQMTQNTDF